MQQKPALWLGGAVGVGLLMAGAFWWGASHTPTTATPPAFSAERPAKPGAGADSYVAGPVKNTLRKEAATLQKLWLAYLQTANAKESGTVEIDWRIGSDGKVSHAGLVSSDLGNKDLEDGLVQIIAKLNFPEPGVSQKYVSHKFTFKKVPEP